jgi:hypothetical protein
VVDDVVGTRDLFRLLRAAGLGEGLAGTILDPAARAAAPVALAEHVHYPHAGRTLPRYAHDLAAAIVGTRKAILTPDGLVFHDLARDPGERAPVFTTLAEFEASCRRDGVPARAVQAAGMHLRRWELRAAA